MRILKVWSLLKADKVQIASHLNLHQLLCWYCVWCCKMCVYWCYEWWAPLGINTQCVNIPSESGLGAHKMWCQLDVKGWIYVSKCIVQPAVASINVIISIYLYMSTKESQLNVKSQPLSSVDTGVRQASSFGVLQRKPADKVFYHITMISLKCERNERWSKSKSKIGIFMLGKCKIIFISR